MDQTHLPKKMAVGWFTFTCSEDSTIVLTELLNEHFDVWKHLVDFKYINSLKSKNSYENLDVAFVEGAISNDKQAEKLKKIRDNSKYLVAVGSCACTGHPSSKRNDFTQEQIDEKVQYYLKTFNYSEKVRKLSDIVKVDDLVEGCPMSIAAFTSVMEKYLTICIATK
jgi:coenzyme F420-reducing hydrogenase gamma subunit